jgi:hypothetical protein
MAQPEFHFLAIKMWSTGVLIALFSFHLACCNVDLALKRPTKQVCKSNFVNHSCLIDICTNEIVGPDPWIVNRSWLHETRKFSSLCSSAILNCRGGRSKSNFLQSLLLATNCASSKSFKKLNRYSIRTSATFLSIH